MKKPRLIVGILAVVHLVLAAMVFLIIYNFPPSPDFWWISVFPLMILPCQGNLVGIWTTLGGKGTPFRVMLIVVAFVIGVCINFPNRLQTGISFPLFLFQMVNVTAVLLVLKFTGLELMLLPIKAWEPRPFQFTIGQMMAWTATLAVSLSACHYLPNNFSAPYDDIFSWAIHISCMAVALASIWLAFGKRRLIFRVIAVIVAVGGGAALLEKWTGFIGFGIGCFMLASQAVWTIFSLLVIRWAGYRMTWHWRLRRFKEPVR
jgi:hypothetical protein